VTAVRESRTANTAAIAITAAIAALSLAANAWQWTVKVDDNAELILAQQRLQAVARIAARSHLDLAQCRDKRFRTAHLETTR
jgi:hypothetical protein